MLDAIRAVAFYVCSIVITTFSFILSVLFLFAPVTTLLMILTIIHISFKKIVRMQ